MKRSITLLLLFVALILVVVPAAAQDVTWTGALVPGFLL